MLTMNDSLYSHLSLDAKVEFLLWFIQNNIQIDGLKFKNLGKRISQSPDDSFKHILNYKKQVLNLNLSMLRVVIGKDANKINALFLKYIDFYPAFLACKKSLVSIV